MTIIQTPVKQEKNSTPCILGSEDENGDAENETDT